MFLGGVELFREHRRRGSGGTGRVKPKAAAPPGSAKPCPGSAKPRLCPAPHPGEPQQRARRVPCGDPHQPPTSPRCPGGGPGRARGRRRSASCGGGRGPHGPTRPRTRHAASAPPALARAPRPPLPRPALAESIARAAPARSARRALRAG